MVQTDEIQRMVQVARLYYDNQLNQEEIALRLGITRQKVSRLLISARERGITRTIIVDPSSQDLDTISSLIERFKLHAVELIPGDQLDETRLRTAIALAATNCLQRAFKDGQIIGIGWGHSVFETVSLLSKGSQRRIHIVPLIGGIGDLSPYFQVNELASKLAGAFGGSFRPLYAPAFFDKVEVRNTFLKTLEMVQISELWGRLNVAVVGIGQVGFLRNSSTDYLDRMPARSLAILDQRRAVGDICSRFFDIHGNQIHPDISVIGIDLDQLKNIPEIIAIAGGVEKVNAILGALRGGYVTSLVTDRITAQAVLAKEQEGGG